MVVPERKVAPKSLPVRSWMVRMAKSMFIAFMLPSGLPRPETLAWRVLNIRFLKLWLKSKISDLSQEYKNLTWYYTRKNIGVSYLRSKEKGDAARVLSLYGTHEQRYW